MAHMSAEMDVNSLLLSLSCCPSLREMVKERGRGKRSGSTKKEKGKILSEINHGGYVLL